MLDRIRMMSRIVRNTWIGKLLRVFPQVLITNRLVIVSGALASFLASRTTRVNGSQIVFPMAYGMAVSLIVVGVCLALWPFCTGEVPWAIIGGLIVSIGGVIGSVVFERLIALTDTGDFKIESSTPKATLELHIYFHTMIGFFVSYLVTCTSKLCPYENKMRKPGRD